MLCMVLLDLVLFSLLKTSSLEIAVTVKTSNPVSSERHAGFFVPEKKKKKNRTTNDPSIPLLGIHPKESKSRSRSDICTLISILTLFIITKRQKHAKCPLIDKWIRKIQYIHTV